MSNLQIESRAFKLTDYSVLLLALACFFGTFLAGCEPFSTTCLIFLISAAIFAAAMVFLAVNDRYSLTQSIIAGAITAVFFVLVYIFVSDGERVGAKIFIISLLLASAYLIYSCFAKSTRTNSTITIKLIPIICFLGFALRLSYILYTSIGLRQHDVQSFFPSDNGHGAYIRYILDNKSLPDFDVRTMWQFYHPPLHHIISAIWIWFQRCFGISFADACEGLQFLTLFYSTLSLYLSYRIMRELNLRRTGLAAALAIVAFHPTFIIFSGSINNDILSVTFMLGAILNTIIWYKKRTVWNILKIALCVGLGMFTKLSVWMVAPAIAVVFLIALVKNDGKLKRLIVQYASFLVVCVPIGLYWSVRNYVKWGVPFTYVPKLSETASQYIGYHSVFERLFDFNPNQFKSVYNQMEFYEGSYFEYNPTIALLKTAMFDESVNDIYYPSISFWGCLLFWASVVLAIVGFVAMIYILFRRNSMNLVYKLLLGITYIITMVSYYSFCFEYPFCCTQSIRYASLVIVFGAIFIGRMITLKQNRNKKSSKYFRWAISFVVVCFCTASAMTYTLIGIN